MIEYERDIDESDTWLSTGMGVARDEGAGHHGESDYQHMDFIKDTLLNFTYDQVHRNYDQWPGGPCVTAAEISADIEDGVSTINFCNHGSVTGWSVAGYNYTHVNDLTNIGKLPYIQSVACVNGAFVGQTCFAEYWMRATHNGEPTGAVGIMAATINQPWQPPMCGQDEMVSIKAEASIEHGPTIKRTYGGVSINGSMFMIPQYGSTGINTHETWILFGDPSLMVRTDVPTPFSADYPTEIMLQWDYITVTSVDDGATVALTRVNNDDEVEIIGTAIAQDGTAEVPIEKELDVGEVLTLAMTGFNKTTYINDEILVIVDGPYANFTADPTTILLGETVTFTDASGGGEFSTWEWDFGDGADPATATGQGPHEVQYNTPGQKTVSLLVDGEYENIKEDYITVHDFFTLTISTEGNGLVEVDGEEYTEPMELAENSTVTLEGVPGNLWRFDEWTGDLTGTDNPTNLLIDGDKNITAVFAEAPLFYECFTGISEGQIPEGWERDIDNYGVNNSSDAGGEAPEMRLYFSPSSEGEFYLTTPEINTVYMETLEFSFKNYLNDFSGGGYTLRVVSIVDDEEYIIWEESPTGNMPAEEFEFILSADDHGVGAENFQLAWVFDGDTWDINNWNFDDIFLDVDTYEFLYTVTFEIEDEDGNPIDDAIVTFNYVQNEPGDYVFEVPPEGNYDYKVEKEGYETVEGDVFVDDDMTIEITMEVETFNLTLNSNPEEGGDVEGEGEYYYNQEVTIIAIANDGWGFVNWTCEDGEEISDKAEFEYTMPAEDISLTANFEEAHFLTLSSEPEEGGTVDGEGWYIEGKKVEIHAHAEENWGFENWTGDTQYVDDPDSKTTIVTMPAEDINLTANFIDATSIMDPEKTELSVFPNPARDKFYIESDETIKEIRLIDISGQIIKNIAVDAKYVEINVRNLNAGVYFIQIHTDRSLVNKRVQIAN